MPTRDLALAFEALFDRLPHAIVVIDAQRRIAAVNPGFTRLFGYEAAEVIGRNPSFFYADPADYQGVGVHDAAGQPVGVIGLHADVSQRHEAEARLQRSHAEMAELVIQRTATASARSTAPPSTCCSWSRATRRACRRP